MVEELYLTSPPLCPGMIMIGGGDEAVNDTLETTSGETVTLTCSLEQLDDDDEDDPITFTWARQDGRPLPDGSSQNDGEVIKAIVPVRSLLSNFGHYTCNGGLRNSLSIDAPL